MSEIKKNQSGKSAPQKRGWFSRNWKWIPVYLLILLGLAAGGIYGKFYLEAQSKINSKPYQEVLDIVKNSKRIQEKLGAPIQAVGWPSGILNDGERGDANIMFDVQGPTGKAIVTLQARKVAGDWGINMLSVKANGAEDGISLKDEADARAKNDTPAFDPNAKPDPNQQKPVEPAKSTDLEFDLPDVPMPKKD